MNTTNMSRVGDLSMGFCYGCGAIVPGVIVTGSSDIQLNDRTAAKIGDIVICMAGHPGVLATSFSDIFSDETQQISFGSVFAGLYNGTIISASDDILGGI